MTLDADYSSGKKWFPNPIAPYTTTEITEPSLTNSQRIASMIQDGKLMLSLEDAHWRLSALPAMCAGFSDRGFLREGAPADVVIYDYGKLAVRPMEIARDLPGGEWRRIRKADGYRCIMVNGEITMRDGEQTGATTGRLLRHGRGA